MAMSFSRPDPSSPASIAEATFGTSRRGFDQSEVKDFLRMVAAEFGRLRERERFLERELQMAQGAPDSARLDDETMTRMLGEESMRVLLTARESAAEIKDKAVQAAEVLLTEANQDAARVREEADIEATRRRADAAADAEAELSMAKQQGREMVNEARAYRERVLSELARRRELAREQIEQLVHGRDRLMQAFERARLVAVDVVAEMQPLGEPNEYVNLAPTTGPLPVMIANSPRPDQAAEPAGELAPAHDDPELADGDAGDGADSVLPETVGDLRIVGDDEDGTPEPLDGDGTADDHADHDDDVVADTVDDEGEDDPAAAGDDAEHGGSPHDGGDDRADDGDDDDDDDDRDGDVVVSLFAKLRADSDSEPVHDERADTGADADDDGATAAEPEHEPTPFEVRDEELTPLIVASAKKMKRVLADEQNEVLDALRRNDAVSDLDMLLPWASEHANRYRNAILEELVAAASSGGAMARGNRRKMRHALITASVDAANEMIETWLVTPLRDRLETCVRDGAGDNAAVTKKIRAVYREWKTQHIDETLDDVVRTAFGRGVLAGFDPDSPVVWHVDERHPACPDCDDNALAGAVAAGAPFPTGATFAPAHQGCRCLLLAADR
ncbi:MAG: DivIVA domain-containing protein [Ilumatobacter sp.]|nr:DivIVA domain-containing protein [Ilumatobacter sp.]